MQVLSLQAKELVGCSKDKPYSYMLAGSIGWAGASFFEGPIDFYKSQWQVLSLRVLWTADFCIHAHWVHEQKSSAVRVGVPFTVADTWFSLNSYVSRNFPVPDYVSALLLCLRWQKWAPLNVLRFSKCFPAVNLRQGSMSIHSIAHEPLVLLLGLAARISGWYMEVVVLTCGKGSYHQLVSSYFLHAITCKCTDCPSPSAGFIQVG